MGGRLLIVVSLSGVIGEEGEEFFERRGREGYAEVAEKTIKKETKEECKKLNLLERFFEFYF
jgi:hypothetical protein